MFNAFASPLNFLWSGYGLILLLFVLSPLMLEMCKRYREELRLNRENSTLYKSTVVTENGYQ